jgi:hypothetical protein
MWSAGLIGRAPNDKPSRSKSGPETENLGTLDRKRELERAELILTDARKSYDSRALSLGLRGVLGSATQLVIN